MKINNLSFFALCAQIISVAALPTGKRDLPIIGDLLNPKGALKGFSVAYDPIRTGPCADPYADFAYLATQGVGLIRVYDIGCDLSNHVNAAAANGLKLMLGLNGINNLNSDLNKLIGDVTKSPAGWGPVDTVYIGNELVNSGINSPDQVAAAVSTARGILSTRGFTGNVVAVDTFNAVIANPTICSTSTYCAVNAHAYFDPNTSAANAGNFVKNAVAQVAAVSNGKRVVVTESGWPYAGSSNGAAIASPNDQRTAMRSVQTAFASNPRDCYLFQAFDASYKHPGQLGIEQFFGLFDSNHFLGSF